MPAYNLADPEHNRDALKLLHEARRITIRPRKADATRLQEIHDILHDLYQISFAIRCDERLDILDDYIRLVRDKRAVQKRLAAKARATRLQAVAVQSAGGS